MNPVQLLLILCLTSDAFARSINDVEKEILQVIQEMIDRQPPVDSEDKTGAIDSSSQHKGELGATEESLTDDGVVLDPEDTFPEEQGSVVGMEPSLPDDQTLEEPLGEENVLDSVDTALEEQSEPGNVDESGEENTMDPSDIAQEQQTEQGTVEEPTIAEENLFTFPEDELLPDDEVTSPKEQQVLEIDTSLPPDEKTLEEQQGDGEPLTGGEETLLELTAELPPDEGTTSPEEERTPEIADEPPPESLPADETLDEQLPGKESAFPEQQDAAEPFPADQETPEETGDDPPPESLPADEETLPDAGTMDVLLSGDEATFPKEQHGAEPFPADEETPEETDDELLPDEEDTFQEEEDAASNVESRPIDKVALQEILEELQQFLPEKTPDDDSEPPAVDSTLEEDDAKGATEDVQSPAVSLMNKTQVYTIKVTYEGEELKETIRFDDETGSETIQVSARTDMAEANIRHCFKQGKTLECFPATSQCFLLSIASTGEPGLQQQKEDIAKCQKQSPSGAVNGDDAEEKTNNWVVEEKVSREDLPSCLADFQPDCDVYSAVKASDGEELVVDDVGEAEKGKRYISGTSEQCANGASTVKKLRQKQGICRYSCGVMVCDYFLAECVCCPEETVASRCLICKG